MQGISIIQRKSLYNQNTVNKCQKYLKERLQIQSLPKYQQSTNFAAQFTTKQLQYSLGIQQFNNGLNSKINAQTQHQQALFANGIAQKGYGLKAHDDTFKTLNIKQLQGALKISRSSVISSRLLDALSKINSNFLNFSSSIAMKSEKIVKSSDAAAAAMKNSSQQGTQQQMKIEDQNLNFLMRFIHWYNLSFKINPFTTIITSNGIIYGGGDVLMQYIDIIKGRTTIVDGQIVPIRYDYKRTIRQTIFGMFIYSPINFVWYNNLLPKIMKTSNPPKLLECFKKMAFDQITSSPLKTFLFLYSMSLMRGLGHDGAKQKIKDDFWSTQLTKLYVYPVVDTLIFTFVPIHLQVVSMAFIALFWSAFLSYVFNKQKK